MPPLLARLDVSSSVLTSGNHALADAELALEVAQRISKGAVLQLLNGGSDEALSTQLLGLALGLEAASNDTINAKGHSYVKTAELVMFNKVNPCARIQAAQAIFDPFKVVEFAILKSFLPQSRSHSSVTEEDFYPLSNKVDCRPNISCH